MNLTLLRGAILAAAALPLAACISYSPQPAPVVAAAPAPVILSPSQPTVVPPGSVVVKPY